MTLWTWQLNRNWMFICITCRKLPPMAFGPSSSCLSTAWLAQVEFVNTLIKHVMNVYFCSRNVLLLIKQASSMRMKFRVGFQDALRFHWFYKDCIILIFYSYSWCCACYWKHSLMPVLRVCTLPQSVPVPRSCNSTTETSILFNSITLNISYIVLHFHAY